MKSSKRLFLVSLAVLLPAFPLSALELQGAGSTAAAPLYNAWAEQWAAVSGHKLSYSAIGSSGGLKAIREGKSDFGASDVALSSEALAKDGLVNFPVAISGVVPIINLGSVARGQLRLTGAVLADILSGRIRQWNASEITALNPGLSLPATPIKVIGREDGSGSTYVLSHYLKQVSESWASGMGNDFKLQWPETTTLVKGTGSMIAAVRSTPGAIGYAEYGQVEEARLNYARVANQKGQYPVPGAASFRAALQGSAWSSRGAFEEMLTNAASVSAWPITGGTFIVMRKKVNRADQSSAVLSMFTYAFMKGDETASKLHWIPLPESTQARVQREMAKPVDSRGNSLSWQVNY
ncbi:MAG: phosphate ABC transporter substrate-binding protein PstS [Rhodocyclaceae bacterium]